MTRVGRRRPFDAPDPAGGPPRAVLVAFDGSSRSRANLDRAIALCEVARAGLTVIVTRYPLPAIGGAWTPTPNPAGLDDLCRRVVQETVPTDVALRFLLAGRGASALLLERAARDLACDTVVCPRRFGGRLRRAGLRVVERASNTESRHDVGSR